MSQFTKEQLDRIWEKGIKVDKYDPNNARKDACGAWMIKNLYNDRTSYFGWEVDHIYPESKLKEMGVPQDMIDNICNLRPLNWYNNDSKGSDYPHYQARMKAEVKRNKSGQEDDFNINCEDEKEINENIQHQIQELFKDYRE